MIKRALLMGILNVTPDSFSDGGQFLRLKDAIDHAKRMVDEGADWIDVGGESTRPGAIPVSPEEEASRVIPVVEALVQQGTAVWVDTHKASVARLALSIGAIGINDITALGDPEMAEVVKSKGARVCLMHMQGSPQSMQASPHYDDVVTEVSSFLHERSQKAKAEGIPKEHILIDPGFGFGKTTKHNLALLHGLPKLNEFGYPVLVGLSRKSFLGRVASDADTPIPVGERGPIIEAAHFKALEGGARVLRVHDVASALQTLRLFYALNP